MNESGVATRDFAATTGDLVALVDFAPDASSFGFFAPDASCFCFFVNLSHPFTAFSLLGTCQISSLFEPSLQVRVLCGANGIASLVDNTGCMIGY